MQKKIYNIMILLFLFSNLAACHLQSKDIDNISEDPPSPEILKDDLLKENETIELYSEKEQDEALNYLMSFFENSSERVFKMLDPVMIDNNYCLTFEAWGKYDNGLYLLDSFTLCPNNEPNNEIYQCYFKTASGEYERFQNTPWYAYSVSPNRKLCIESMNIAGGILSGSSDYALGTTRILDMSTAEILWESDSFLHEKYFWSDKSEYIARQYSGRQWTVSSVIDAKVFEEIALPMSDSILELTRFETSGINQFGVSSFKISNWLSGATIKIDFGWENDRGNWVQGSYDFSVIDGKFEVTEIEEILQG